MTTAVDQQTRSGSDRVAALPISVVIPAYNAARFIAEALVSVKQQTAQPTEVIVVDDGSTDTTGEIARAYGASVIRQNNQGLSAARNTGLRAASQPWIALLDADDIWEPEKLERQWAAVVACPDVGAVFSDFIEFDANGPLGGAFLRSRAHYQRIRRAEVGPAIVRFDDHDGLCRQFYEGNFILPSTLLVRRHLLFDIGLFDPTLTHCEDRECWLRLLAVTRMAAVERPMMRARSHDSNLTGDHLRMLLGVAAGIDRILAEPHRYPPGAAAYYRTQQPRCYLNAGRVAEQSGKLPGARDYYLRSWRLGGGLRPLVLAALTHWPAPVRSTARRLSRLGRGGAPSAADRPVGPSAVLFVENSIGLSGSTVSLCTLLQRLDSRRFASLVVVSRPEQATYLRRCLDRGDVAVIRCRPSLKSCRVVRHLRSWARRLGRPAARVAASAVSALDLVIGVIPYLLALYRFGRGKGIRLIHHNNGFDVAGVLLARAFGVPIVAYQRGEEWNSPLVRLLARFVDLYVANSGATRQSLLRLGVSSDRITIAFPPVDLDRFHPGVDASAQRREFALGQTPPTFGIIGTLLAWKGHVTFLHAARAVFDAIPHARALIIGAAPDGDLAYRDELGRLAVRLGLADQVIFTGFRTDVPELMQLLDVVVHTSTLPEPFGRVIVEAMAMGKPVVAARAGGPLEIIEDGRNGFLIPPGDASLLAARVIQLLREPNLARRVSSQAIADVCSRFSAVSHGQLMGDLYEGVLAEHSRRRP